jgi:nucleoside-diphosphate-sugar epimerase
MNHTTGYVHERPGGMFYAMIRLPMDGQAQPIKENGKPKPFKTAYAAQKAATERLCAYWNGKYRRDGETLCGAKSAAEKLFEGLSAR